MKTYTVYFSEPVTVKYKGDRFNKELKKWEYDVDCEKTSPMFTFYSLTPAKKLIKENMDKYIDSIITKNMVNEVIFYLSNTLTKPLHKTHNTQRGVYSIGFGNKERVMIDKDDFYVFWKAVRLLYICNKWVTKDNEKQSKEPDFKKGNKIMYTIKDSNSNAYPVRRLSERVYESKEHKTLFITDEEGTVVGIYKEK